MKQKNTKTSIKQINIWYTFVGSVLSLILIACTTIAVLGYQEHHNSHNEDYEYKIYRSNMELALWGNKANCVNSINNYMKSIAPSTNLNGVSIFEACDEYCIDIIFTLAQAQIESSFGTAGVAAKTNSVWNVLAYDGRSTNDMIADGHGFKHPDQSIKPYLELLKNKYLVKGKTEIDLMQNYVNGTGHRYASDKSYETRMQSLYKHIKESTDIDECYNEYKHYKVILGY